jgi:HSP20 family molecular chaperone IbpA
MTKKPSFFSRLTGNTGTYDDDDYFGDPVRGDQSSLDDGEHSARIAGHTDDRLQKSPYGELAVDVYQTPDAIIVKALIAGVQPNSVDIALTREMITISGARTDERESEDEDYFHKELYWGAFARTILLPEEVDVDLAEASEKHGVLMIRLPKVNKKKQTKLKVRSR